jgi:hypothetical protein
MTDDEPEEVAKRLREKHEVVQTVDAIASSGLKALAVALGNAVAPGLGTAGSVIREGIRARSGALRDMRQQEAMASLEEKVDGVEAGLRSLRDRGFGTPADVARIVDAFLEAWGNAQDARVRRVVRDATVSAFDAKRYEEGLSVMVLDRLGRLPYGALYLLKRIVATRPVNNTVPTPKVGGLLPWYASGSLDGMFASLLEAEGLIFPVGDPRDPRSSWPTQPTELAYALVAHVDLAVLDESLHPRDPG